MTKPVCAQAQPYAVPLEKGKVYAWCQCGLSEKQPFCDGRHAGTGMKSYRFCAESSNTAYLCGCKQTKTPPFCDGSHTKQG